MPPEPGLQPARRSALTPARQRLLSIMQGVRFGRIEGLIIRNSEPCFEQPLRIVEEIRLASDADYRAASSDGDFELKKEVTVLFDRLTRLRDGVVNIEVRHSAPFRLVLERCFKDLAR
jgi:hypothetical protein